MFIKKNQIAHCSGQLAALMPVTLQRPDEISFSMHWHLTVYFTFSRKGKAVSWSWFCTGLYLT